MGVELKNLLLLHVCGSIWPGALFDIFGLPNVSCLNACNIWTHLFLSRFKSKCDLKSEVTFDSRYTQTNDDSNFIERSLVCQAIEESLIIKVDGWCEVCEYQCNKKRNYFLFN